MPVGGTEQARAINCLMGQILDIQAETFYHDSLYLVYISGLKSYPVKLLFQQDYKHKEKISVL